VCTEPYTENDPFFTNPQPNHYLIFTQKERACVMMYMHL